MHDGVNIKQNTQSIKKYENETCIQELPIIYKLSDF